MKTFYERMEMAINTGQAGLWVQTAEPDEFQLTVFQLAKSYEHWQIAVFDCVNGLQSAAHETNVITGAPSAAAAVKSVLAQANHRLEHLEAGESVNPDERVILIIRNADLEIVKNGHSPDKEIVTLLQSVVRAGQEVGCHVILQSFPGIDPPVHIKDFLSVLEHTLPNAEERSELLESFLIDNKIKKPSVGMNVFVEASSGLTRQQVKDLCAMTVYETDSLDLRMFQEEKAAQINSKGLIELHTGKEKFDSYELEIDGKMQTIPGVGGYHGSKKFLLNGMSPDIPAKARLRAALFLGIPGAGKSMLCKALGNELLRPTLVMDPSRWMDGIVGSTEKNTREAFRVIDTMEPAIAFCDEFADAVGGDDRDGGVGSRQRGSMLIWMNDHTSDVLFVATANDISKLPAQMLREERFDYIFMFDLPGREAKDAIWDSYIKYFALDPSQEHPDDGAWTGAEIKSCCRKAANQGCSLMAAARWVSPVVTKSGSAKQIQALREFAHGEAMDAETGELYDMNMYIHQQDEYQQKRVAAAAAASSDPSKRPTRRLGRKVQA